MKIPSLHKIEMQAKAYSKQNPVVMPESFDLEYAALQKEKKKWDNQWHKIRGNCPGDSNCICQTFPEYQTIMLDKLLPIVERINRMYCDKINANQRVYLNHLQFLNKGRNAKISFAKSST